MNIVKRIVIWISQIFILSFVVSGACSALHTIYVAYSTDSNYIFPTLVSMTSLMSNADKETFCNFYVLHNKISDSDKDKLNSVAQKYKNCSVSLVDVQNEFAKSYGGAGRWSDAMYFRFLLPDILKKQKKCIYIDGDTIVRHDLCEMYGINMSGYYIGGIIDGNKGRNLDHYLGVIGLKDVDNFICSGVLLMNLEKIRKDNIIPKLREAVLQNDKDKKCHYPDQDILNKVCYGHIKSLPFKYGALTHNMNNGNDQSYCDQLKYSQEEWDKMKKDPTIVHFTGGKPWKKIYNNVKKLCYEWWKYANRTGYSDEIRKKYCA